MEIILTHEDLERLIKSKFNNVKNIKTNTKSLKITITLEDDSLLDKQEKQGIKLGEGQDKRIEDLKQKKGNKGTTSNKPIKHKPKVSQMGDETTRRLIKL